MQQITRLLLLFVLLSCACTKRKPSAEQKKGKSLNLIVLLDLSDRLTIPGQVNRDTVLLRQAYHAFEQHVRRQFFINSHDQLHVLVAPQKNQPANIEIFENRLRISMQELPVKERASFLRKNEPLFFRQIDSLYHAASGKPASSFSGSDIWKFFDQYLRNYLAPDTNTINKIIVLTDGYFDFESLKDKKQEGCRYSYSEKLMQKGRALNIPETVVPEVIYEKAFDSCGLIPVRINQKNVGIMLTEITPRNSFDKELELLESLWKSWYNTMGIAYMNIIRKGDMQTVKSLLSDFILSIPKTPGNPVL